MSAPKEVYFVRHGRTEWNAIRRMQGQWNSDLDDLGREQAGINGRWLAGLGIQAMFASPLDRTRQTAQIINRHLEVPILHDERLKEWDSGDWSGWLYPDIEQHWPDEWRAWRADPFHYRGPNCENYPDMIARSRPFLQELRAHPATSIAVVSHGMIGKAMIASLLGLDPEQTLSFHQPNDRVYRLRLSPDGTTRVDYFDGGEGPYQGLGAGEAPGSAVRPA
ncbi:MAG: histidine phosphatase family protein [Gammaproteobacteria bacterium]|nr:histidine phosphatase family protein [Gammaproteobacteria bacterium]